MRRGRLPLSPPATLLVLYAALVVLGTGLLEVPFATTAPIGWLDAAFTATSAVTITGLGVVDTGTGFTAFGQVVILVLIQCGGLGIMTFAVRVLALLGVPIGVRQRIVLQEDLNQTSFGELISLVQLIVKVVFCVELMGAVLLAVTFVPDLGWREGLWSAVFHAVSAFNNAGFALYPDSLMRWAGDPMLNLVVPALIIVGGLGFTVLAELYRERRWRAFTLHTRLMLAGTGVLIPASVILTLALEWTNPGTLAALPTVPDRLLAGWFQAVTTRTAGFNTVEIGELREATSLMFMALMLIGGGSTSTAGGVKVTTFVVLLIATWGFLRKHTQMHAFGRSLREQDLFKVMSLAVMTVLLLALATFVLVLTQSGELLDIAFEAASALGTVGLSRGLTGELDAPGRLVIMVLMFAGRVGPLAFGFFLAARTAPLIRYPAGKVYIG